MLSQSTPLLKNIQLIDRWISLAINLLTKEVPQLKLHILDHLPQIRNMTRIVLHRQILLDLPRHIPAQIHLAQTLIPHAQMQDDRTRQLIMGRSRPVDGFEDVYRVPDAFALGIR